MLASSSTIKTNNKNKLLGTPAGDPVELNSIDTVFCKDRNTPLLVGSMKANTGHAEPASGLNSIAKVIFAMEKGSIPATINHKNIRKSIEGLITGRLCVVDQEIVWPTRVKIAGVNSFGFGGANGHLLLKGNTKSKKAKSIKTSLLVCVSARTREGVQHFLENVKKYSDDSEYIALLHSIFR